MIFVWSYDLMKLKGVCDNLERYVTSIEFMDDDYCILLACTDDGKLILYDMRPNGQSFNLYTALIEIDLTIEIAGKVH